MRGSILGILALGLATIVVVVTASAVVSLLHIHATDSNLSFFNAMWEILQRAIDPGQLANEHNWSSRMTLLVVTGIGLLLMSTLISIVNSTIESRLADTRHGRRPIDIEGHIAIIGWNDLGTKYTEELAEAREDGETVHALILSAEDPVDLINDIHEDLVRQRSLREGSEVSRHPEKWLAARRGHVDHTADLRNFARLDSARSAIVLSQDGTDEDVVTTVLAIIATLQDPTLNRMEPLTIVAPFKDSQLGYRLRDRIQVLVDGSGGGSFSSCRLIPVTADLIRSGIESQVARHRGLSEVYRDLVDFDGEEFYLVETRHPSLTFGDLLHMDNATPIGVKRNGILDLWPSWDSPLDGCEVIVLAHDHGSALQAINSVGTFDSVNNERKGGLFDSTPETFLIIGWNNDARSLVRDLKRSAPPGSTMCFLVDEGADIPPEVLENVSKVSRRTRLADPLDDPAFIADFDHVLILSHDGISDQESDSRVLIDILACRGHANSKAKEDNPLTVVAELRQRASKHIAGARLADDLLVNDSLAASTTVQLAVHPELEDLLTAILTPGGSVRLRSLAGASRPFVGMSILETRLELARTSGDLPLAVRRASDPPKVTVNPGLHFRIEEGDEIIVLSRVRA
jgi:hypothetical protein